MDFVFDRAANGRAIKCLTIVDDATHEAVAIQPKHAIGGLAVTRILDRLAITRGLLQIIRTDNGKEFCGHAMLTWAHQHGVTLRLIEPGKPNQNAYKILREPLKSFRAATMVLLQVDHPERLLVPGRFGNTAIVAKGYFKRGEAP